MNSVGHINHGLWTHPRDESHRFNELNYWTDLAKTLEQDLTLKESIQLPSHDPSTLISAMAAVTQNLGFGVTVNLSYETPYQFARRFASLDHLTQGRIGWNIVTGFGKVLGKMMQYKKISKSVFLLILKKFIKLTIKGAFIKAKRTPVLFQAGASPRGLAFSTRHAECVFIGGDQPAKIKQQVDKIRELAVQQGRNPEDIKIFVGITVVTAETDELAQEKLAEYARYASPEAGLAHFSSSVGIDLSKYADDEAIPYQQTNSIASVNNKFKENQITPNDLKAQHQLGGRYPLIVGSGIDGFNLTRTVAPESHHDFIHFVIPELQQRGRFKTKYESGSLRNKIFKQGDHLTQQHPAADFRCQNSNYNNSIETADRQKQTA
ncbi:unnamed protein product [Oppiella nova]|uniref:Luciferase-like domain-containing protein n=1 Tax=Oppiella nova TaxID=334625 RepID=A0A7R9L7G8_9ACAR|nr:unnamed protein product [Oppiella nova]CAG2157110.1 unnamed protein product [Oppiella nova]